MHKPQIALFLALSVGTAFAAAPAVYTANSEDGAQVHCPLDKVVWLNTATHKYYFRSSKHYANSAKGGFACLQEAKKAGAKRGE